MLEWYVFLLYNVTLFPDNLHVTTDNPAACYIMGGTKLETHGKYKTSQKIIIQLIQSNKQRQRQSN